MAKITFTGDDGSIQEFDVVLVVPALGFPEAEIAKVETEAAALDAELKSDETVAG